MGNKLRNHKNSKKHKLNIFLGFYILCHCQTQFFFPKYSTNVKQPRNFHCHLKRWIDWLQIFISYYGKPQNNPLDEGEAWSHIQSK